MLKQSSESKFNSSMAETLPHHLPLLCQYSPTDSGVKLTLAVI